MILQATLAKPPICDILKKQIHQVISLVNEINIQIDPDMIYWPYI